jgi:hypothetical protein
MFLKRRYTSRLQAPRDADYNKCHHACFKVT